jgi:hypothetical protein
MSDDYGYHVTKWPHKTYISKSIGTKSHTDMGPEERRIRIASKVMDSNETHEFARERGELVIRVTQGGRQEIIAKFYEDTRGVYVLTLQRFTTDTGIPHRTHFSFVGSEIDRLLDFVANLRLVKFPSDERVNVTDRELKRMLLSPSQVRDLISQNQELVIQLARSEVTVSDIVAVRYRREQLATFERLLNDPAHFEQQKQRTGHSAERMWQTFFESNRWVFGYGLTYVYLTSLDQKKLEQAVVGHDPTGKGKRADALMKTRGAIEALCFVEIKSHNTPLLCDGAYRPGAWAPSQDVSGGVTQVQVTVENAIRRLREKIEPADDGGDPTGEELFSYQPKSFLVVGSLNQMRSEHGINIEKYRSFELYRRCITRPEIITFDELLNRAKFIVEHVDG